MYIFLSLGYLSMIFEFHPSACKFQDFRVLALSYTPLSTCFTFSLSILSAEEHLSCFQIQAFTNNAAINIEQVSFEYD